MKRTAIVLAITSALSACGGSDEWRSSVYETPEALCQAGGAELSRSGGFVEGGEARGYCVAEGKRQFSYRLTDAGYVYEALPSRSATGSPEAPGTSPSPSVAEPGCADEQSVADFDTLWNRAARLLDDTTPGPGDARKLQVTFGYMITVLSILDEDGAADDADDGENGALLARAALLENQDDLARQGWQKAAEALRNLGAWRSSVNVCE